MKNVFWILMAASFFLSQPVFAHGEDKAEHIAVMREAADELKESNPELSKKLDGFADKKENWKDEHKNPEQKRKDIAKIKEASGAVRGQNEGLANDLDDITERWEKKMAEKEKH